jgi:hypothetical protein
MECERDGDVERLEEGLCEMEIEGEWDGDVDGEDDVDDE